MVRSMGNMISFLMRDFGDSRGFNAVTAIHAKNVRFTLLKGREAAIGALAVFIARTPRPRFGTGAAGVQERQ
jgi:hypothetical protein